MNMAEQHPPSIYSSTLKAFSRALARESHVLTRNPGLLWQQMFNRLQGEGEDVKQALAPELARRRVSVVKPWLRLQSPNRESGALMRILEGHTEKINGCSFSPDGKKIASVSGSTAMNIGTTHDCSLRIWDTMNGAELFLLTGHRAWVNGCSFSPDGKWIVSASSDSTLILWEVVSGRALRTLTGHTKGVVGCVFHPDGKCIVSAGLDGTLKIWDVLSGQEVRTLKGHTGGISKCGISPDGSWILSASQDGTLKIWDSTSGRELRTLRGHKDAVNACAISPDGKRIVSVSRDLKIWDAVDGRELTSTQIFAAQFNACAISPDGTWIITGSRDRTLRMCDMASGRVLQTLFGHYDEIRDCAISPDGASIVSSGENLYIWDSTYREEKPVPSGHTGSVRDCSFSPDGSFFLSASDNNPMMSWDTKTSRYQKNLKKAATGFKISPDGKWVVSFSGRFDKDLKIWDPVSGDDLFSLTGHTKSITGCDISPDGSWILSTSEDDTLKVWESKSGEFCRTIKSYTMGVFSCAISPSGRSFISIGNDILKVWDAKSGSRKIQPDPTNFTDQVEIAHVIDHLDQRCRCAVSPDGTYIVTANYDKTLRLWDFNECKASGVLRGHKGSVTACAVSPDGKWIFSTGRDKKLIVWDKASENLVLSFDLLCSIECVSPHPWMPMLVCGDYGGGVYRLDLFGIPYGPIIVTAWEDKHSHLIRCPACGHAHQIKKEQLDREMICPTQGCGLHLRLNPFVIQPLQKKGFRLSWL